MSYRFVWNGMELYSVVYGSIDGYGVVLYHICLYRLVYRVVYCRRGLHILM